MNAIATIKLENVSKYQSVMCFVLGQAKLIIRFPFPPACFFANATKFSLYGNLHHMDFQIFTNFSLLYCNFHYCNNEFFLHCFLKIAVIMNNEK